MSTESDFDPAKVPTDGTVPAGPPAGGLGGGTGSGGGGGQAGGGDPGAGASSGSGAAGGGVGPDTEPTGEQGPPNVGSSSAPADRGPVHDPPA